MKIGIFGGSFNPPHNMHKNIALNLIESGYIDKVIFVPVGNNYNKPYLINYSDRYKMLEIMTRGHQELEVSDLEKDSSKYTYEVLDYFQQIYKDAEIYFICGTDNLNEFDTWQNYMYILENYKLLVIKRNNLDIDDILNKFKDNKDNVIITDIAPYMLSSTEIRDNIDNDNIKEYLDEEVYKYIRIKKIY